MSGKRYRFTTQNKQFESDNAGLDYLKEENGITYARETKSDNWSILRTLETQTSYYEWWQKNKGVYAFWTFVLAAISWGICVEFVQLIPDWITITLFLLWNPITYVIICVCIDSLVSGQLKKLPSYLKTLSEKEITNIIEREKRLSALRYKTDTKTGYSGYQGNKSNSYSGGPGGGTGKSGYNSGISTYVSHEQLDGALKAIETKGISVDDMVNKKNNREREELFAEHFGNNEQGAAASECFNKQVVWPARKSTLKKLIEDGDYENESDKQQLSEKLNAWGEEITNDNFQKFAREIKTFTEKKHRKENHIKYEGRLSNKAIQSIKEYHGYICMGCGLDPVAEYGESMKGILEAHHKKPWAEIENEQTREVNANDFFVLCPNCHKMIHTLDQPDSLDELKEILNPPRKISWWD